MKMEKKRRMTRDDKDEEESPALKKSTEPGTVILVADTDFLRNDRTYADPFGRLRPDTPTTHNAPFFFGAVDYLSGSTDMTRCRAQ